MNIKIIGEINMSEMAQVLIRKAVRQNGTTYVALPIGFVRENDIQPGDKLWIAVGKKSVNVRKIEVPE